MLTALDRDLSRIFRPPPGNACRIVMDRTRMPEEIVLSFSGNRTDIYLGEKFVSLEEDAAYRSRLAAAMLAARYGLKNSSPALPVWIQYGLEGVRRNAKSSGKIVRNLRNYPVLRALLGAGYMPDFRALMQLEEITLSGNAREAFSEFSRFLLEMFAKKSGIKNNVLGDYVSSMLKGGASEESVYRATLQKVMNGKPEADFFRAEAGFAAFNARTPRPAEELLKQMPDVPRFSFVSGGENGKGFTGTVLQLPGLFKEKHPLALAAKEQVRKRIAQWISEMPPECSVFSRELILALEQMNGGDPDAEIQRFSAAEKLLKEKLQEQERIEQFMEDCQNRFVQPGLLFREELSVMSQNADFLTGEEEAFFDRTEQSYLEN